MSNVTVKTTGGAMLWQSYSLGLKSVPWVQRARRTVVFTDHAMLSHRQRSLPSCTSGEPRKISGLFWSIFMDGLFSFADHVTGLNKTPSHAKDNLAGKRRQQRRDTQQQSCCGFLWFGFLRRTSCYRHFLTQLPYHPCILSFRDAK